MSPNKIVSEYPTITLADVYAALAYYLDHKEEIQRQIRESEEFAEQLASSAPSVMQEKLKQHNAESDSVSSWISKLVEQSPMA